jgi:hypothetical protein
MKRADVASERELRRGTRILLILVIAYGVTSLLHFSHNAIFLRDYPHLPLWLTAGGVWTAWCGITAIGLLGYVLYRFVSRGAGLLAFAIYALLGFGGLDHYVVAPVSAHSMVMNTTILIEVVSATALLSWVGYSALQSWRLGRS